MAPSKPSLRATTTRKAAKLAAQAPSKELVIVTGISGSGKASALKEIGRAHV